MQEAGCAAPVLHSSRGLELIAPGPNLHIASSPPLFMSHAQHHNVISMRTTQMCTTTPSMQVKFQVAAYPLCATQLAALPGPCLGCPHRLPLLQVAGTGPSLAPDLTVYATCCCVVELILRPAAGRHHDGVLGELCSALLCMGRLHELQAMCTGGCSAAVHQLASILRALTQVTLLP
jgi:hypothetical protein